MKPLRNQIIKALNRFVSGDIDVGSEQADAVLKIVEPFLKPGTLVRPEPPYIPLPLGPMAFHEWLVQIEDYSSTDDPIWYKGKEMTPRELPFDSLDSVARIRIAYYAKGGMAKGTMLGMLRDRMQMKPYQKPRRSRSEPYKPDTDHWYNQ